MNSLNNPKHRLKLSFLLPKYWGIWLGYGILRLIAFLPYTTKIHLGENLGKFIYWIAGNRKKVALKNLKTAFPEKDNDEINTLLFEHFKSLGVTLVEFTITTWGKHRYSQQDNETRYFTYYGLEHLEENRDQGILLLVPHFTTTEITGLMVSFITDYSPIYRANDNALLDYLIRKSRTQRTQKTKQKQVTPLVNTDTKSMLKALRDKKILFILPDQKYNGKGSVKVPFFGKPAPSNPGITKLAKLGQAKVIPCFTRRNGVHYEIYFHAPLENFPSGNDYEDILRLHKLYEDEIRQNPSQYLWVHNRWRQ